MLSFFKENSYAMVKMLVTQFGMTVFGTMLVMATWQNASLFLISNIFSVLFYLFLLYVNGWELGAKDKIRIDGGRMEKFPMKGFLIALCANIPNLLLALLMGIGAIISVSAGAEWAGNMSAVCSTAARLLEGMYLGFIRMIETELYENPTVLDIWWWFIVITLPAIFTGWLSYLLGSKDIRILSLLGIKPNLTEKKK